jgi:hypothetical protein
MDKTSKKRHNYFYLPWTKRERIDLDTFTYMGITGKRRHKYFYLSSTKREREDKYVYLQWTK